MIGSNKELIYKVRGWNRLGILALAFALAPLSGASFKDLASFSDTNGAEPQPLATLIQGPDGNLYGTTYAGGSNTYGAVFQLTPAGALTAIYSFTYCALPTNCDGATPAGGLVLGTDGNFYGATQNGGANYAGTVFQVTTAGILNTIYSFCAQPNCVDGVDPVSLVPGDGGILYGATSGGGAYGSGTIFSMNLGSTPITLYNFTANPGTVAMVQGSDGNVYGTTYFGGTNNDGTVFRMTPSGAITILHTFAGTDGAKPAAGVIQASDGNFYGTTSEGGAHGGGTIFRITPAGRLNTLYHFSHATGDYPLGALTQSDFGGLFGTTAEGGTHGFGTIFKLTLGGAFTTVYNFSLTDGFGNSGLFQATNGTFYGTTYPDSSTNFGGVFSLAAGFGPFVETVPSSGVVGQTIQILGTDLTGTRSVNFNKMAAAFVVVSATEITATVPAGATDGFVTVATPKRFLESNVQFRVNP